MSVFRLVWLQVLIAVMGAVALDARASEIAIFSTIPWHMLGEDTVVPHPIRSGWVEEILQRDRQISLEQACRSIGVDPAITPLRFEIYKSQFVLVIFAGEYAIKTYPVSMSGVPIGHKTQQGDKKTPEGSYNALKHYSPTYGLSYYVSYPSRADALRGFLSGIIPYTQFRRVEFAEEHRIAPPADTPLGGKILIHTSPPMHNSCVTCENWSMGCVVMEPQDLRELLSKTPWFDPIRLTIYSVDIELPKEELCMHLNADW